MFFLKWRFPKTFELNVTFGVGMLCYGICLYHCSFRTLFSTVLHIRSFKLSDNKVLVVGSLILLSYCLLIYFQWKTDFFLYPSPLFEKHHQLIAPVLTRKVTIKEIRQKTDNRVDQAERAPLRALY